MSLDSAAALRHGGLGIASFILSLVVATVIFLDFGFAGFIHASGGATPAVDALVGIVLFFGWFLGLVSIGLGIAGYFDKSAKAGFSVAGMGISGAVILLSLGIMILGLMHKS